MTEAQRKPEIETHHVAKGDNLRPIRREDIKRASAAVTVLLNGEVRTLGEQLGK